MKPPFYVSITGLKLNSVWHTPKFWRHATASMVQAKSAEGCLAADARTISGIHHTRSVWRSRSAMENYLQSGAHLQAMRTFPSIATGKVCGFDATEIPDWEEVHQIWCRKGRSV